PAVGEEMLEAGGRRLPELVGPGHANVEALVSDLAVVGHGRRAYQAPSSQVAAASGSPAAYRTVRALPMVLSVWGLHRSRGSPSRRLPVTRWRGWPTADGPKGCAASSRTSPLRSTW